MEKTYADSVTYTKGHRREPQDSVALLQILLSVIILASVLALVYLLPSLFDKIRLEYIDFVTKPLPFDPSAAASYLPSYDSVLKLVFYA